MTEEKKNVIKEFSSNEYCAVWTPSLTDSMLIRRSPSLLDHYALVPTNKPKKWGFDVDRYHLEHQLFRKEHGFLLYNEGTETRYFPRLGLEIRFIEIDKVSINERCWQGKVELVLKISLAETLGLVDDSATPDQIKTALKAIKPFDDLGDNETDSVEKFFSRVFGVQLYNVIRNDPDMAPDFSGSTTSFADLKIDEEYCLTAKMSVSGSFFGNVDVGNFPFDVNSWNIIFSAIGWSCGLSYDSSFLRSFPEFEVFGIRGESSLSSDKWNPFKCEQGVVPNAARGEETIIYSRFHSRRRPWRILGNVYLPASLVTLMGISALWVSNDTAVSQTDPLAMQSTAVLTLVALKLVFEDMLPKGIGFSTLIDSYLVASLILVVVSVFVLTFVPTESMNEKGMWWIYLCLWGVIQVVFFALGISSSFVRPAKANEKIYSKPHTKDEHTKDKKKRDKLSDFKFLTFKKLSENIPIREIDFAENKKRKTTTTKENPLLWNT